jgi:hypothetical protein
MTTGGAGGMSGGGGTAGTGGSGGSGGNQTVDVTMVRPTAGCGMAAPGDLTPQQFSQRTIMTSGSKVNSSGQQQCLPGGQASFDWEWERQYFVRLPQNYDNTKAYPVVLQGPGCGSNGDQVYGLGDIAEEVIKVGFSPPDSGTNCHQCCQGCFDDKEGDDSIEFPFFEGVWDLLATELCFDQNRVFMNGNSSGAWWSNELGCVYSGHPTYPIRAIGVNTGGLPTDPTQRPTCAQTPMAGMWIHGIEDPENPWDGNLEAIKRAMAVNGCPGGDFAGATKQPYAVGDNMECVQIMGCPELYPLVACALVPGDDHDTHSYLAEPGFAQFFGSFFAQ